MKSSWFTAPCGDITLAGGLLLAFSAMFAAAQRGWNFCELLCVDDLVYAYNRRLA